MATVISFVNNKGGVGKTTLACIIAQALGIIGHKVLAIDNDGQHNLSTMLGLTPSEPNIGNLYSLKASQMPKIDAILEDMTLQTTLTNVHCITAPDSLCDADVTNERILAEVIQKSYAATHYDYIIIDNHPGISALQRASLHAAEYVFVPTELQQLAVNGLSVMYRLLTENFSFNRENIKIIPNKYRNVQRQEAFLTALKKMFPKSVTTAIPVDSILDIIVTEEKILLLDRYMSSKAVPYIIKMMTEIFTFKEKKLSGDLLVERNKHLAENARNRVQSRSSQ
ncbi:MAG: ParA family protein [Chitinispirillales bacterium]|jgi:chromosome partitioning protein|nr:ParA family protein [Chitinispirillales bacterium]